MITLEEAAENLVANNEDFDPENAQHILGRFSALAAAVRTHKDKEVKRMWDIGVLLAKNKTNLTVTDLARAFGVERSIASRAKSIAKKMDCNEEAFIKKWDELGNPTWSTLMIYFYPSMRKKEKSERAKRLIEQVKDMTFKIDTPEQKEKVYKDLLEVQRIIIRLLPLKLRLTDVNYLPYSPCACCGEYSPPPETGYELRKYKSTPFKYPICQTCAEMDAEPDPDRVIELYANYALNIEATLESIEEML